MATRGRRPTGGDRATSQRQGGQGHGQRSRPVRQEQGPIPVLAKAVHGVEVAVSRGRVTATTQATFQAVALLVRELREQAKTDQISEAARNVQLKRIEGAAAARLAARAGPTRCGCPTRWTWRRSGAPRRHRGSRCR